MRVKVIFDHDPNPDFSWLESWDRNEPIYRNAEDMAAGKPLDWEWYTDPDNHVALQMLVLKLNEGDEDWQVVDSCGGIDFFADGNDWQTGTFYHLRQLANSPYLQELAREAGLPE